MGAYNLTRLSDVTWHTEDGAGSNLRADRREAEANQKLGLSLFMHVAASNKV